MVAALATLGAGCGSSPDSILVRENFEAVQAPHRGAGTPARPGQVVQTECKLSAVYKVREATGTAFLTQSQRLHLRLRVPGKGTKYELECLGPLLAELPAGAVNVKATARDLSGRWQRSLSVRAHVPSARLAPRRSVLPAPGKQLVIVQWAPRPGSQYDNYRVELAFRLPKALILERVVYTASVSCGGSSYLQPVLPLTDDLGFVNAFTVPQDEKAFDFILPRLAPGINSYGEETRALECR